MSEQMTLAIVGHVDHGKSTTIGRLLADTGVLADGKLEQVKSYCEKNSKPFEYAFLLDALRDERRQGITIDSARVFFKSEKRRYLVLDTPGHLEFLKNMITGSAQAEAAMFVVDVSEGLMKNALRHAHMLSLLGVQKIIVLINKMDRVDFSPSQFERLRSEIASLMSKFSLAPIHYIPVSSRSGDNLARRSEVMSWYQGPSLIEALDALEPKPVSSDGALRVPIQDVYDFSGRQTFVGNIESGRLSVGDRLIFYPSKRRAWVKTLETFPESNTATREAGESVAFTVDRPLVLDRGEIATRDVEWLSEFDKFCESAPNVATDIRASIFWLGQKPFECDRAYVLKIGTARVNVRLQKVERLLDATNLDLKSEANQVARFEVAQCLLKLDRPIAFDMDSQLGRFVLVDDFEISGGGIIRENCSAPMAPRRGVESISQIDERQINHVT